MTGKIHQYTVTVQWTGNEGNGTRRYNGYSRNYDIAAPGKAVISGSADPAFRGDASRWNPEELLVASLSACHKLWYLHLCSEAGVVVESYQDGATGLMQETADGGGQFVEVTLQPVVVISSDSDLQLAEELHASVPEKCFIARSVNFPVHHKPEIRHNS